MIGSECLEKLLKLPSTDLTSLLEVIIQSLCTNNYQKIRPHSLSSKLCISTSETEQLIGWLLALIRQCLHWFSHSETELRQGLTELGLPGELIASVMSSTIATAGSQKYGYGNINRYTLQMEKLVWRIDISLCNSTLKRSLSPTILWNVQLSNGEERTVEISLRKYHQLRFNIASILKEIFALNKNTLVKK